MVDIKTLSALDVSQLMISIICSYECEWGCRYSHAGKVDAVRREHAVKILQKAYSSLGSREVGILKVKRIGTTKKQCIAPSHSHRSIGV
jgi:hypothetical protein